MLRINLDVASFQIRNPMQIEDHIAILGPQIRRCRQRRQHRSLQDIAVSILQHHIGLRCRHTAQRMDPYIDTVVIDPYILLRYAQVRSLPIGLSFFQKLQFQHAHHAGREHHANLSGLLEILYETNAVFIDPIVVVYINPAENLPSAGLDVAADQIRIDIPIGNVAD